MSKRKNKIDKQSIRSPLKEPVREKFTIKDYMIMNIVVWGFIGIVALGFYISAGFKVDGIQTGILRFIFLYAFGCVFFVVSIIDYIMDRRRMSDVLEDSSCW